MRFVVLLCAVALTPALISARTRFARSSDHEAVDFTGHKVIRMKPATAEQAAALRFLEHDFELDYWNPVFDDLRPVLTIIDPQRFEFLSALNRSKIAYDIVSNNYQQVVDAEKAEMEMARMARNPNYDYETAYHTYAEIVAQMKYLAANSGGKATYSSLRNSYEGREIPVVTVGSGSKIVFLESGIHSREWVTIAFGQWIANKLVNDAAFASYLTNYKFIIVPVLNVDGFAFTHSSNRLWRKTRAPNPGSTCLGADPNRNWDTAFCQQGASSNPCSETFCGPSPFSDVETKAMSELIRANAANTVAYFAIHSYSQLWMYPWGYTTALPPNNALLKSLSQRALSAIKAVNNLDFVEGTIANAIYLASGSSADWAYDVAGIKVAFALELRDKGQYGFQLPANQIRPAVLETWAGIKAVIDQL